VSRPVPTRRKALYFFILYLLTLVFIEVAAQVTLRVAYGVAAPSEQLHVYDRLLGWANIKNYRVPHRYGLNKPVSHNSLGFRGSAEYSPEAPDGRHRIVFLGDSFPYGTGVGDTETFPALVERLCPAIQSLNMGVAGYGIDQSYLSYTNVAARIQADAILFTFIEDDFRRMALKAFLTQNPKPQLAVEDDELVVLNVPVPTWGAGSNTSWFKEFPRKTALFQIVRGVLERYLNDYDPWPVVERLFVELDALSRKRSQEFVLVYLPTKGDFIMQRPTDVSVAVKKIADRHQIGIWNLTDDFKVLSPVERDRLFGSDGVHYNESGNRRVAEAVLKRLPMGFVNSCSHTPTSEASPQ
jgi:hypothetical protein